MNNKYLTSVILLSSLFAAQAKVTLPSYVTDNMILQQNSEIKIKGKSIPGKKVTVIPGWDAKKRVVASDKEGNFSVSLSTPSAGGPYNIQFIDDDGSVNIENVVAGEVWLCSGQSNMEFPMNGWATVMGYDTEIPTAQHPDIRLLQVRKNISYSPNEDVEVNNGGWQICNSASVADFSAVAYLFARELSQELGIPIGVIDTTWGGTPAEAWTSQEALKNVPGFETELSDLKASGYDRERLRALYDKHIAEWLGMTKVEILDFDPAVLQTGKQWGKINAPGYWENNGLTGLDGIVFLQKEFMVPENLAGLPFTVRFAAIDDEDDTYINGQLIGRGSGYNTPRKYEGGQGILKAGKNIVTIKVSDFGGEGGLAPGEAVIVVNGESMPLSGEWNYKIAKDFASLSPKPADPASSSYPSVLYNAMLSPLKDMPIKGVIWYQGCANVGRDKQYEVLFQTLIKDWRQLWGENMPFYFVQLAGYLQPKTVQPDSQWAALRDAQAKALCLNNTGMATAIDLGHPTDIHPRNKQEVAHRLALLAFDKDYGKELKSAGPVCTSCDFEDKNIILTFNEEVKSNSCAISGFIIAGEDGNFTTATPKMIDKNIISLSAPGLKDPKYVKYNWADYPCGNLYGTSGLPVAPFAYEK